MSIFDEQLTYTPSPTFKERVSIGKVTLTENQRTWLIVGFFLGCVGAPLAIFVLTGFNFILGGITFVLADLIWGLIHYNLSIVEPHKLMRQEILGVSRKKIKDLEENISTLNQQYHFWIESDGPTEMTEQDVEELEDKILRLQTYLQFEKVWVDEKLTKYKQDELEMLQRPVKEYEEKRMFFEEFKERLELHISANNLTCLQVVLNSLVELMSTLDKRPEGYELVPTMFYIYIDELQKIVAKICKREQEQIDAHMQDLTNVANALSQNMNRMVKRIQDSDASEIDVGLSVLLKELGGEEVIENV